MVKIISWLRPLGGPIGTVLRSYAELFFLQGIGPGILIFMATCLQPTSAITGLISFLSAYGFARLIRFNTKFLSSGFYTYNPILVGFSIGYMFHITPLTIFFTVTAGVLTFVMTLCLAQMFYQYLGIAILSVPFVLVSSIVYLAVSMYSGLYFQPPDPLFSLAFLEYFPYWATGFFNSIGAIIFLPYTLVGMVIFGAVLWSSRIMAVLAFLGYFFGAWITTLYTGLNIQPYLDINNFNYILIAVAIGSIFLIPSFTSYLIALIGVAMSTLIVGAINVFWATYGIPVFTLPFNVITLSLVYILLLVKYPYMTRVFKRNPEENLEYFSLSSKRFSGLHTMISLPFSDSWRVWQGFDGQWTHKGAWRYAYDFVKTDASGSTFKKDGVRLEDYYCYKKPVLSPVRGEVTYVMSDQKDNLIGQVDTDNNWGNLVMIKEPSGFFVVVAHFAKDSIGVVAGDWVEVGGKLGSCGNSGYSPEPHIHLQVQLSPYLGDPTVPFRFDRYCQDTTYVEGGLPENIEIHALPIDPFYDKITTFLLGERLDFQVYRGGISQGILSLVVEMDTDGSFYFSSGKAKLYFGKTLSTFFMYNMIGEDLYLALFFQAFSKCPLRYIGGARWQDTIPHSVVMGKAKRMGIDLLTMWSFRFSGIAASFWFDTPRKIKGELGPDLFGSKTFVEVDLDIKLHFKRLAVDNWEFVCVPST